MRVKSAYRRFASGGAVLAERADGVGVAPEAVAAADSSVPELSAAPAPIQHEDASGAFQAQIAALRAAEEAATQRKARETLAPPVEPEIELSPHQQVLRQWKSQGLSEDQAAFLRENPRMIENPQLTAMATAEAHRLGHEPGSAEYFETVRHNFNGLADRLDRDLAAPDHHRDHHHHEEEPAVDPLETARRYSAPEPRREPRPQVREASHYVSAPVSREVPSSEVREIRELNSGRVTLSVLQREIAKAAGLSDVEYAMGLRELARRKRDGELQ